MKTHLLLIVLVLGITGLSLFGCESPGLSGSPAGPDVQGTSQGSGGSGDGDWVWVAEPDQSKSCEPGSGLGVGDGSKRLGDSDIEVKASKKMEDGNMHIQMCGADTGKLNVYQIKKADLERALALGFESHTVQ